MSRFQEANEGAYVPASTQLSTPRLTLQIAAALNAPVLMTMTGQPNATVADYYNRAVRAREDWAPVHQSAGLRGRRFGVAVAAAHSGGSIHTLGCSIARTGCREFRTPTCPRLFLPCLHLPPPTSTCPRLPPPSPRADGEAAGVPGPPRGGAGPGHERGESHGRGGAREWNEVRHEKQQQGMGMRGATGCMPDGEHCT